MDHLKEKEALLQIKDGKSLNEFDEVTDLMKIAAATYQKNAFDNFTTEMWTKRLARMAINKDFKNAEFIPQDIIVFCAPEFASAGRKLTRKNVTKYQEILCKQDPGFIKNVIRRDPGLSRFVSKDSPAYDIAKEVSNGKAGVGEKVKKDPFCPPYEEGEFDFMSAGLADVNELDPETFLSIPVEDQTQDKLMDMAKITNRDFPSDFIKRLQTPHRNEAFYKKAGDEEKAAFWSKKKVPYLNKEVCMELARLHPEGSVDTPAYLTSDGIASFWQRKVEEGCSKAKMTAYFLSFPEELLSKDMLDNMNITWEVLRHAPSILLGSEQARLYLNRHPDDILRLQEEYQEERRVIADGVKIFKGSISQIKNEDLRERVAIAFNIDV